MYQKTPRIISKKIRNSAKGKNCTLRLNGCRNDVDTVIFAHINTDFKGIGNKSPDLFGVYACSNCHDFLDDRHVLPFEVHHYKDVLRALTETQMELYKIGLIEVKKD